MSIAYRRAWHTASSSWGQGSRGPLWRCHQLPQAQQSPACSLGQSQAEGRRWALRVSSAGCVPVSPRPNYCSDCRRGLCKCPAGTTKFQRRVTCVRRAPWSPPPTFLSLQAAGALCCSWGCFVNLLLCAVTQSLQACEINLVSIDRRRARSQEKSNLLGD